MYAKYFGLNEKPFSITPDPRYLFMSERHSEGLAHLVYGVKDSSGFIQLTGEVGTGKTTLVRTLLARIPAGVDVALILNPQLSAVEFVAAICEELKIRLPEDKSGTKALVDVLNQHLLKAHADGKRTILLIDEAQNLATEVLEQIRLLTNLETAKRKLLQIILIAQPELREKLSQTNLRQLAQRVTGRYHLEPLSKDETVRYIDHRLKIAGGLGEIFDERAKREVFRHSKGVPRLINVICDRALLGAYSREVRKVTQQMVRTAAGEVSGDRVSDPKREWLLPAIGLLTVVIVIAGIWAISRDSEVPSTDAAITIPLGDARRDATGTNTLSPPSSGQAVTLDTQLQESVALTSTGNAMTALLSLWSIEFNGGSGTACAQADAAGLRCLHQRGSWNILQQLDRPAVLTLTDSAGQSHEIVVTAVRDDSADLMIGEGVTTFTIDEIANVWFGRFVLLWRPPNGDSSALERGIRGPKVLWLRQSLAALDPERKIAASDSDLFDEELEQQLVNFQRRNRLQTDGLAGQQTQIIINSRLGLQDTPRLVGT